MQNGEQMNTFYARDFSEWHDWLVENHQTCREIWLLFYKPESGNPSVRYEEAVEEALCFGWVDSLIKGRDEESHLRKFTPRKHGSTWSEVNIHRAQKMIAQGRRCSLTRRRKTLHKAALYARSRWKPGAESCWKDCQRR
jgi:uncharacterized protein YdeI (YjbR/CyaY-like superfamily)